METLAKKAFDYAGQIEHLEELTGLAWKELTADPAAAQQKIASAFEAVEVRFGRKVIHSEIDTRLRGLFNDAPDVFEKMIFDDGACDQLLEDIETEWEPDADALVGRLREIIKAEGDEIINRLRAQMSYLG